MKLRRTPIRLTVFLCLAAIAGAQVTNHVWTGANATQEGSTITGNALDPANWSGNTLPPVSSSTSPTATLTFSGPTVGSQTATDIYNLPSGNYRGFEFLDTHGFYLASGAHLGLGVGGITQAPSNSTGIGAWVDLLASQEWIINGSLNIYGGLTGGSDVVLTKSGFGTLSLGSMVSAFTGELRFLEGTLLIPTSSILNEVWQSPIGTGRLTLGSGTTLGGLYYQDTEIFNPITLGTNVTLGLPYQYNSLTLHGEITPEQTKTTLRLGAEGATFFAGNITDATAGPTALTLTNYYGYSTDGTINQTPPPRTDYTPVAVFAGNNTYSGGTQLEGAGVVFLTPTSLPTTGNISALGQAYVGVGFDGGMTAVISRIADPLSFEGALGFDTNPDASSEPTNFNDTIDLSGFANDTDSPTSGFWGLGSLTFARLTANSTITPPEGGNYVFGGGEGTLYVGTNLNAPSSSPSAGVRVRSRMMDNPLTVYLQGNNTFTGNLYSDHSIVILDSPTALPADAQIGLDSEAYVGITEKAGLTPAQFISRLNPSGYNSDSILGFDHSPDNESHGVTVSGPIDLSDLSGIYLGSTTHAHLTGAITAPSNGVLALTGVKNGWLTIDSVLGAGVSSVVAGLNSYSRDTFQTGIVELANSANTYTGGTTLKAGYLVLGGSSTLNDGNIASGPLGTGILSIESYSYGNGPTATLAVSNPAGVTLHNPIHFSYGSARFGVPDPDDDFNNGDDDDAPNPLEPFATYNLTLAGNLTGMANNINFIGDAVFTLSGNNSDLEVGHMLIGSPNGLSRPLVVAKTAQALGSAYGQISLGQSANLQFTSADTGSVRFVIGSIGGGTPPYTEAYRSRIALDDGDVLEINQQINNVLYAQIAGAPADWANPGEPVTTTASLVKNGYAKLVLAGRNYFSGGITINEGGIVAANDQALGTGNITINGGTLGAINQATITNNITFGSAGGRLGGNASFDSPITVGANVTLAPGQSPGTLTFNNGLTFAANGSLDLEIVDMGLLPGIGYDLVDVTNGTFAITATTAEPFHINISSLSALSNSLGALTTDTSAPYTLTILQSPNAISGLIGNGEFGTSNVVLNTNNFTAYQPGQFSLAVGGAGNTALMLNFTPVPEPSTYALMGVGLALVGWQLHRRRTRRS